ncbi:unnamed protein product, partial [Discosporangium mesarthrocarpum]
MQNGCGTCFSWKAACPYKRDCGLRKEIPFTEKQPEEAAKVRHLIAPGIPLCCDRCHQEVVGPLFRCFHCPTFACWLDCQ